MAVRAAVLWPAVILLWMSLWEATCDTQHQAEEEEIFLSENKASLSWTSDPAKEWDEIHLAIGTVTPVPVLQGCKRPVTRTVLSPWMERKEANHLLMDIVFAQEEEPSGQLSPLQVHLFDTNTPITRFRNGWKVHDLQTSRPFHIHVPLDQISSYLNRTRALSLGPVRSRGFHLAFSYSGACVLITSVRLYYNKCPAITSQLASFKGTGAGSGPVTGSCVEGAVETSTPVRECDLSGVWGPMQGVCECEPGHQAVDGTCQACRIGYYKPANESGGCRLCPPNSKTHGEGSVRCMCLQGFSRLPTDPHDFGCTKPPSAPVNVTAQHHNDSLLIMTWDPPHDLGGRQEVVYRIICEELARVGSQWGKCGNDVVFLPDFMGLNRTSVSIAGLDPQRDYRLSVQALTGVSGAPPSSTATITIHRWKVPPVVITVSPGLNVTGHYETIAAPQHSRFPMWLSVGVLFAILLLVALIPIGVCIWRQSYTKFRSVQEEELLPMNPVFSYRRQLQEEEEEEAPPQQTNMVEGVESMAQMLEGLGGQLLHSLKEVLVERNTLTLGKELGKGEFGSVFEGLFTPAEGEDTKVAVKTMKVGIHSQEDLRDFLREAEIMKNFDHENVVRLLAVTLQREQDCPLPVPLAILPYMKHGDLRRFLIATRYGDLPMFVPHQSLLRFMIDIAAGMDYLTQQGFIHRDLAARNCMLGDDLRVRVADFGLSKKIYSSNYYRQRVVVRLPIKWMAMESLSESVYTSKSDVWSFGVTMWEIVSRGRTPYPGVHNFELLELLQSGHRLKPPSDCDQKLYEVMRSCWDQEPSRRPDFRDLGDWLKDLLMELPVLEAEQEATYINQGLEAAAAAAACQETQQDSSGRLENVYLPTPLGAAAARDEDVDVENGYLKCIPGSATKADNDQ